MKKRILSLLLALVMVLSALPVTAFAQCDHDGADGDGDCDVCKGVMSEDPEAPEDSDAPDACEHTFNDGFYRGVEDGHYKECDKCYYYDVESFEEHTDEDNDVSCDLCWHIVPHDCVDEDTDYWCDRCLESMPHEHSYKEQDYEREEEGHYLSCGICFECDESSLADHVDTDGNEFCDVCLYFMNTSGRQLCVTTSDGKTLHDGASITHGDVLTAQFPDILSYDWFTWEDTGGDGTYTYLSKTQTYTVNGDHFGNTIGKNLHLRLTYPDNNEGLEDGHLELRYVPVLVEDPYGDVNVALGGTFTVSVEARGRGPLSYQWYLMEPDGDMLHEPIEGATGSTYKDVLTEENVGHYVFCMIQDAYGNSITSEDILLPEPTELEIMVQPEDAAVKLGETYEITVEAEGDGLKYQWWFKSKGHTEFHKSAVKTNTYSDELTDDRINRQVYCVITDQYGNSVQTDTVTIKGVPEVELTITSQPVDDEVKLGERYEITVEAEGEGLKYQWWFKSRNHTEFHKSDVKTNTYSAELTAERAGRQVYCVVTDMYGNSVQSDTVTIHGDPTQEVKITRQPEEVQVKMGEEYCVAVEAEGEGLTYQWWFKSVGHTKFHRSAVKDSTYGNVMTEDRANRLVYCVITDAYGHRIKSETVKLVLVE